MLNLLLLVMVLIGGTLVLYINRVQACGDNGMRQLDEVTGATAGCGVSWMRLSLDAVTGATAGCGVSWMRRQPMGMWENFVKDDKKRVNEQTEKRWGNMVNFTGIKLQAESVIKIICRISRKIKPEKFEIKSNSEFFGKRVKFPKTSNSEPKLSRAIFRIL